MQAFLTSTAAVALAEIGDKTQLLALVLATRYRRPVPIVAGILVATLANHGLAGLLGAQVATWLGPEGLRWTVGIAFLGMAGWTLIPDKLDATEPSPHGAFWATLVAFFFAEMGDKTQLATVGLAAAHPGALLAVVGGTTLGMMLANVPVVLLGDRLGTRVDLSKVRYVAALLFAVLGTWVCVRGVG
ncbi:MAG: TMEM165/GDT1 family protein [Pseudomonadota bacterium]|nr:TMEM165/GDT1 family protein [Pseudomonadota bacterium]